MKAPKPFPALLRVLLLAAAAAVPAACTSIEYKPDERPRMVVTDEHTPVYFRGPAQGNGPDLSLAKGDEVLVLRREFGFSVVRTTGGQTGYVANDALSPAPPEPAGPSGAEERAAPLPDQQSGRTGINPAFRY
jgi:hypothetical protein